MTREESSFDSHWRGEATAFLFAFSGTRLCRAGGCEVWFPACGEYFGKSSNAFGEEVQMPEESLKWQDVHVQYTRFAALACAALGGVRYGLSVWQVY